MHRIARTGEQVEVQLEAYGIKGDTQDVHFELWDNDYLFFDNKHAQIKDQTIRWSSVGQSAGWKKGSFTWTVPASSNLRSQFAQTSPAQLLCQYPVRWLAWPAHCKLWWHWVWNFVAGWGICAIEPCLLGGALPWHCGCGRARRVKKADPVSSELLGVPHLASRISHLASRTLHLTPCISHLAGLQRRLYS
jgi:hypothetical protein